MNKIDVLIPARGGSKGLPGKNLKNVGAATLLEISIAHGKELLREYDGNVYVSTEDREIRKHAKAAGAKFIDRPPELATDEAGTLPVIHHALQYMKGDHIILLQCTHPLRFLGPIIHYLQNYLERDFDSGLTAIEFDLFLRDLKGEFVNGPRKRRQDLGRKQWLEDGSFYIFSREVAHQEDDWIFGKVLYFPGVIGPDIHTQRDLEIARRYYNVGELARV